MREEVSKALDMLLCMVLVCIDIPVVPFIFIRLGASEVIVNSAGIIWGYIIVKFCLDNLEG